MVADGSAPLGSEANPDVTTYRLANQGAATSTGVAIVRSDNSVAWFESDEDSLAVAAVLAARPGFPRKIKPLVRLTERETAAYCVVRGIDYQVDECPMAAGNRQLRLKETLNDLERRSPGAKHDLYFRFLDRAVDRFVDPPPEDAGDPPSASVGRCDECGAPTTAAVCAYCRLRATARRAEPVALAPTRRRR